MGMNELEAKVANLRELRRMAEELAAEITTTEDELQQKTQKKTSDEAAAMAHNLESREETVAKIEFYIPMLTDAELRMVSGFIRRIIKGGCRG